MLKTNREDLPMLLVQGQVRHSKGAQAYRHTIDGEPFTLPATGGITLNAKIGDRCVGWAADHLEPGVTARNENDDYNAALQGLSCIGNTAIVMSGDAKGARGFVTGKHGGCEHLLCYFDQETMEKMTIGDKIDVRSQGQGMKLIDYPDILLRNMSPELLEKMNIEEKDGKLKVGVAKIVPACIMGSGLGASTSYYGDRGIWPPEPAFRRYRGHHRCRHPLRPQLYDRCYDHRRCGAFRLHPGRSRPWRHHLDDLQDPADRSVY